MLNISDFFFQWWGAGGPGWTGTHVVPLPFLIRPLTGHIMPNFFQIGTQRPWFRGIFVIIGNFLKGFYPGINVGAGSPKGERGGKVLDEPGPTLKGYHDNNPKLFFGVASKYCNYPVLRASPVSTLHWQEHLFIKVCSRIAQIVLISSIDGSFLQWSF